MKNTTEIIRLMAKWYVEGDGTCKIAKKLTEMNIPSPKGGNYGMKVLLLIY